MKALGGAVRAREHAERERAAKEQERARLAEEAEALRSAEGSRLERGELHAADLQRQGAWEVRTQWDDEERARGVATAREGEGRAKDGEGKARGAVASAEAEAKVVDKHRDEWVAEGERAAEAVAEEGAREAWRPRR